MFRLFLFLIHSTGRLYIVVIGLLFDDCALTSWLICMLEIDYYSYANIVDVVVVVRVGRCGTMTTCSGVVTSTTVLTSPRRK